jgi:hypothetical protein
MDAEKLATAVTNLVLATIDTSTAMFILIVLVIMFVILNGSLRILEDMVVRKLVAFVEIEYSV